MLFILMYSFETNSAEVVGTSDTIFENTQRISTVEIGEGTYEPLTAVPEKRAQLAEPAKIQSKISSKIASNQQYAYPLDSEVAIDPSSEKKRVAELI